MTSWGEHGDTWWTDAADYDTPSRADFDEEEGPCRCSPDSPCECPQVCEGCGKLGDDGMCESEGDESEPEPTE